MRPHRPTPIAPPACCLAGARPGPRRQRERGIVLLYTLIALVIMLIGAMALMRSFNESLFATGNLAFKRDLQNRAEQASVAVLARFETGLLATEAARGASMPAMNYSATELPSSPRGIPLALVDAAAYAAVANETLGEDNARVRYVVDRLCNAAGPSSTLGTGQCIWASATAISCSTGNCGQVPLPPPQLVYRLSVRVDGPRGTQGFFQTTFTAPTT